MIGRFTTSGEIAPCPNETVRPHFRTARRGRSIMHIACTLAVAISAVACRSKTPEKSATSSHSASDGATDRPRAATTSTAETRDDLERYYERALREFALADFLKPDADSAPERIVAMAPLIVREIADAAPAVHFGEPVEPTPPNAETGDGPPCIVYYHEDTATLAGIECNRLAFLWMVASRDDTDGSNARACGFRMTLDADGFATYWEVLTPSGSPSVLFVAKSIEEAAEREFGAVEPGRRFAVELPVDAAPKTVVARILSDGPQPMGPFAYIDGRSHDITTLLCRCMASQIDAFRDNVYYQLRPLPRADASESNGAGRLRFLLENADQTPLDERVRFPSSRDAVP